MWDEIGDRIYRRRYPELDQNIGAIVTDDGLVVIDSRSHPHHARILRDELVILSSEPVRWLINTHRHWDHCFGNQVFPQAVIVGHRNCRDGLLADWQEVVAELKQEDWFPPEERIHFDEVDVVAPTLVFDERSGLWAGGRRLELSFFGRGHTDGDIVVSVDDVTFAGDLVEEGAPPSVGDSFPRDWVETLRRMAATVTGVVVPGHGDLVDRGFVLAQADEMAAAVAGDATSFPAETVAEIRDRLAY
jgi:glyoxylase-like metal-dependent hydrolase (beta-lactamase superfamily II)